MFWILLDDYPLPQVMAVQTTAESYNNTKKVSKVYPRPTSVAEMKNTVCPVSVYWNMKAHYQAVSDGNIKQKKKQKQNGQKQMELRKEGGCLMKQRGGGQKEGMSQQRWLSLSPSLRTDVCLRLIFPLRVYSSALSPPSPGDFMRPEQPERPFVLRLRCSACPTFW